MIGNFDTRIIKWSFLNLFKYARMACSLENKLNHSHCILETKYFYGNREINTINLMELWKEPFVINFVCGNLSWLMWKTFNVKGMQSLNDECFKFRLHAKKMFQDFGYSYSNNVTAQFVKLNLPWRIRQRMDSCTIPCGVYSENSHIFLII